MLYGMPAFVGGHGGGGHRIAGVHGIAEVHRFVGRIEMVGQLAGGMGNLDVGDSVVPQHLFGHVLACQPSGERDLRIFIEYALEPRLYDKAGDADNDDKQEFGSHGAEKTLTGR